MVFQSHSQELVPPIQNFTPQFYGAASQNWDVAQDEEGMIYVANNQGLLVYDGINWELMPLENEAVIRAVHPHRGKIYTGSYQDFGYWETTEEGCLVYNSLVSLMSSYDMQSEEFWEITSFNDAVYFRSFAAVYKYENGQIHRFDNLGSRTMEVFDDKLFIAHNNRGLLYLDKHNNLHEVEGDAFSPEMEILDMERKGDSLLIGGSKALFVYHKGNLAPFKGEVLASLLSKYELNHIENLGNGSLVLGTIKNGIIHYNLKDESFRIYNRSSGLQNNTVLGVCHAGNQLWLALDRGIDVIDLHSPIEFYTDNSGELGAVYDIVLYNGVHYLASNTGVYRFENGNLNLIEGTEDHTWNLEVLDGNLYVNHNRGTFLIKGDTLIPLDTRRGSFIIKKVPTSSKLIIGDYNGLSIYEPSTGEVRKLEGAEFPIRDIVFESENKLWAAHAYEGLYTIEIDNWNKPEVKQVIAIENPSVYRPRLAKVNNQILFYLGESWYRYNAFSGKIELFEPLEKFNGMRLIHQQNGSYVFVDSDEGSIFFTDLKNDEWKLSAEELDTRLVKLNENITPINDSIFLISLNDGFARLNINQIKRKPFPARFQAPVIREFRDEKTAYSLKDTPVIPFSQSRTLTIKTGFPGVLEGQLRYVLEGEETLSGKVENGIVSFRNLDYGNYDLRLYAFGTSPPEMKTFQFEILPPWYLSNYLKPVYLLLVLALAYFVYWLNRRKLRMHQFKLEEKFEKEHKERINRLEKEKLRNEIDLKRKELANTTMIAAKKNEVLMEIQAEINKDKSKFSNQYRIKHIMNKINTAVKNKDEWKVFETNFNEVHEDFFKDLLEKYPKLTSKDLKLCSYLKMNLSSKEIAPLMGISVRGVEVHRYRLRKKMQLESDVNLSKFLIKNF